MRGSEEKGKEGKESPKGAWGQSGRGEVCPTLRVGPLPVRFTSPLTMPWKTTLKLFRRCGDGRDNIKNTENVDEN